MRLFARRRDSRPSSEPRRIGPARAADRPGRRARRRARPEAEALDPRLLMASGNLGTAGATASPDLANRVAQALQPYFAQDQFPGISVAVVTDGQVALAQGYGLSNVATGSPVQADTRFDIGSVTKTFTALGVLLLYQESQGTSHPLDLNAPISEYLHNTKSFKLPRKWSQVTTMELLDMTSGIRDVGGPRPWQAELRSIAKRPPPLHSRDGDLVQRHELRPARRAHRAVDRRKVRHLHPGSDPATARDVRDAGAGPVRDGPEPGGRIRRAQAREVAEGRGAERTGDVRLRRDGLDGPGHGHLYDGPPERPYPRSGDLRS